MFQPDTIPPAHHILYKYADKYEFLQIGLNFLKKGLDMNEVVMLITDQFTSDYIINEMKNQWHVDANDLKEKKQIIIHKTKEWYYPNNTIENEKIISKWKHTANNAIKDGRSGLRAFADTGEFFQNGMSLDLIRYESALEQTFDFPFTAVCAYSSSSFSELELEEQRILLDHHHSLLKTPNLISIVCECGATFPSEYYSCPKCGMVQNQN